MKKWYTKISAALALCIVASFSHAPDALSWKKKTNQSPAKANFQNLVKCATDKNPKFLQAVVEGVVEEYHKEVELAIKERDERKGLRKLMQERKAAIKAVDFLFHDSRHFKQTFEHEAHNPHFEQSLNKLVQHMFHLEWHAADKHPREQQMILKDYQKIVADFKKRGVKRITNIEAPKGKEGMPFRKRMSEGASSFLDHFRKKKEAPRRDRRQQSQDQDGQGEDAQDNQGGEDDQDGNDYNPDQDPDAESGGEYDEESSDDE